MAQILIGDGLHQKSLKPLAVGLSLAKTLNQSPLVLHADKLADFETLDSVFAHLNLEVHQNYIQSIIDANNAALEKQIKELDVDFNELKFESRSGSAADVIVREAEAEDVNLIVLGHEPNKSWSELFLGGVTESILHRSPKSVLVVKSQAAANPKKIMLAYDFSYHCDEALKWTETLADKFGAEIHLVNVVPCYYEGYHVAHTIHDGFNAAMEEMIDDSLVKINARLEETRKSLNGGVNVAQKALLDKEGSISDKLVDYVKDHNIDLVIMGSHKKGAISEILLGSVSNKMLKKSPASVLIAK